ncbi:hypothetical protein JL107_02085 [Nakamurella flavida]|uniref:Uncharacterized protein n=1 Tax=Nakamurella flavida TaxID=363630 RepID=A0A938YIH7_9ACTN|nr:hypothetical protein [Nakamurella flavida]MBM9475226.1 hypothetical protein [Nakamurella flavida]MDP9776799.1 hypothetical protein [Nakamurella flavida]
MAEYAVVLVVGFLVVLCGFAALLARPRRSAAAHRGDDDRSFLPATGAAS